MNEPQIQELNIELRPHPLLTPLQRLHLDLPLLIGLMILAGIAAVVLWSASGQSTGLMLRQMIRSLIGFGVLFTLAQIPPRHLQRYSPLLYLIGVGLLVGVLVAGVVGKGAQRWLDLRVIRFQPSEILKIATPMMVAWVLTLRPLPPNLRQILLSLVVILTPTLLIALQPDLGTAILVASAGGAVLFLGGISYRLIFVVVAGFLGMLPILWQFMHDYQRDRVRMLIDPDADPLGRGYHIIQSKIAIGSGGMFGKGWLHGTQNQLEFLPERSTDFIFAVYAEEFGLVGNLTLIAVYLAIVLRCFRLAMQAQNSYARLLAGALATTFFVYVFVNIGMVIGVLPVVGVPLPLISYGGTSMVTLMAGFGILMSAHTHRRTLPIS